MDNNTSSYTTWAISTLKEEAHAIENTANNIDKSFNDIINTILHISGKVVLTGLGKSGHIARKVSATLSSTGTPSVYLHPSEALHGDLGMISSQDCLIAIAFGGETSEVIEVVKFAKRISVPVISITGKKDSSLYKLSDFILDGSVEREACPLNLAPTSSSTVALALGDALAVTLMRAKGFDQKGFAQFHPGGSLGIQLSLVKTKMITQFNIVNENTSFMDVLNKITSSDLGIVPVVSSSDYSLIGSITDGDLRRAIMKYSKDVLDKKASDIMNTSPKTITEDKLAMDALKIMEDNHITSLFVTDSKSNTKAPIGIIRMQNIIKAKK